MQLQTAQLLLKIVLQAKINFNSFNIKHALQPKMVLSLLEIVSILKKMDWHSIKLYISIL